MLKYCPEAQEECIYTPLMHVVIYRILTALGLRINRK